MYGPIDKKTGWHLHHILYKKGIGPQQQMLVQRGSEILREVGINHATSVYNLVYAPNSVGQHTLENLKPLVERLEQVRGDKDAIIAVLEYFGKLAAGR